MFKIPEWDDDIPTSNGNFAKKNLVATQSRDIGEAHEVLFITINKARLAKPQTTASFILEIIQKASRASRRKANAVIKTEKSTGIVTNEHEVIDNNLSNVKKTKKRKKDIYASTKKEKTDVESLEAQDSDVLLPVAKKKKIEIKSEKQLKKKPKMIELTSSKSAQNIVLNSSKNTLKVLHASKSTPKVLNPSKVTPKVLHPSKVTPKVLHPSKITPQVLHPSKATSKILHPSKVNDKIIQPSTSFEKPVMQENKVPVNHKKEKLKKLLESNRKSNSLSGNKLRERMLQKLKAAQFRYLNEKLYTSSGSESQELFKSDPTAFQTYHQGYQQQVKKWPVNPLDTIVKKILKLPKTFAIADMGCGEAALSKRVPHTVRSFDLVASAPGVEVCDMAHTPLLTASVDVAVYCLALMGTELTQYLVEANRILKKGGQLLVAEVESRFTDANAFAKDVERLGFKLKSLDKSNQVFFFLQFVKIQDSPVKKSKLPILSLKPCYYKRR